MELTELGILEETAVTDDWETLCHAIRRRLREQDDIRYLLVMMDEADDFIADCGAYNYKPLAELKSVQQTLPGQFKFVLAGLHNIVRFNREVALGRNSVITHLPSLKITPFRTPEAQELLTGPLSYLGLSLPSKVTVSQILATVNYFPGPEADRVSPHARLCRIRREEDAALCHYGRPSAPRHGGPGICGADSRKV